MVKFGARPGQMISSGRQPGTAKLTNGKKGTHQRKIARFNADCGCSIQSDSDSQAETVRGLHCCASLMRDILKNEDSGSEILSSKSRCNYRPLDCKKCSYKKKEHQKHSAPSAVRKEILSSDNKKLIPNEASTGSKRDNLDLAQSRSLQDHYRMYSPIIYQALCEHVQTQMSLMNNFSPKDGPNGIPTVPCHTVSGSDSVDFGAHSGHGCSTSASVWSPQQLSCPLKVHSVAVQTGGDNQLGSQGQSSSVSYPGVPQNLFNISPGIACSLPYTDEAAIPAFQQLSLANWILPQQRVPQEADLLKCFQTHMSLFPSYGKETLLDSKAQQSPSQSQSAFVTNELQIGKATNEGKCLNIHVQDAKIAKNVQTAKNANKTAEKVRTIKYLLGELQALVGEQKDSEVQRLVTEVEACISGLSQVNESTDIQVEIALAMQPLRSENAQLRRQLRILNQHLREQEKTPEVPGNLELFSLQSLNMSLHNQLQESLESQELLRSKNEELLQVIENQRDENKKFTSLFKDKEQTLLQNKQQFDIEMTRVKMELEEALANEKNSRFKLETAEKENQILGITLRQRDAEVSRLRELTRTLQSSMAKLLSDLSVDTARHKPGNNLTKSLLDIYDKQLEQDHTPPHTTIMSYLDQLETNHSLTHSELLSTVKNEATREPDRFYERVVLSRDPSRGDTLAEAGGSVPGPLPTFSEQGSDTECETVTLMDEDRNLDSTLYIPFARSSSKKHSPPVCKRISPQPKISTATTQLVSNSAVASKRENKLYAPRVSSQNEAEDAPVKLPRPSDSEDMLLLRKIKEAIGKVPVAAEDPKEQAAHGCPSAFPGPGVQVKGSSVCDGSVLNCDLMSDWSISSFSTFTSHDEQDFRNGLAALDANIARLQKSLKTGLLEK